MSSASTSNSGAENDCERMCAKSDAVMVPDSVSSAMKGLLLFLALRAISSAASCVSLPAMTKARPTPDSSAGVASLDALLVVGVATAIKKIYL